ncbi:MAG: 1,4-dihydroxy-2-naphthoate octaprenyltransferase [Fidelibacterota bacterium]
MLLPINSISVRHLGYNPYIHGMIHVAGNSLCDAIQLDAYAEQVRDSQQLEPIVDKFALGNEQDAVIEKYLVFRLTPLRIDVMKGPDTVSSVTLPANEPPLLRCFFFGIWTRIKRWTAILRASFFSASIAPVFVGAAVAYNRQSEIHWGRLLLTLLGAVSVHAAANVINDYYDHRSGNDAGNRYPTAFSGGSRMIQEKIITPATGFFIALFLFAVTMAIGLYLNSITAGNNILYIGIIGILLAFFYSAAPLKLAYRGIGELAIVSAFGPIIVMGTYYVQVQSLDLVPLLVSIPAGVLVGLILFINEFQDMIADKKVQKNTLVVRARSKKRAVYIYGGLLIFVYLWLAGCAILGMVPIWTLLVFITIPMVYRAVRIVSNHYDQIEELLPANALTIGIHLLVSLLVAIGFILDAIC